MAITKYLTPFKNVHRRVVRLSSTGVSDANAGNIIQGMWVQLVDGEAELDASAIANQNGGVVFTKKASFNASYQPENITIISDEGFIFEIDSDAYNGAFTEGTGVTVKLGKFEAAAATDPIVGIVERDITDGVLRIKLTTDNVPPAT